MTSERLANCPFCGGKASIGTHAGEYFVGCETDRCPLNNDAGWGWCMKESEAIAAWNRRVVTPAQPVGEPKEPNVVECNSEDGDCVYCSGEACARCIPGIHYCDCDSFDRHMTGWPVGEFPIPFKAEPPASAEAQDAVVARNAALVQIATFIELNNAGAALSRLANSMRSQRPIDETDQCSTLPHKVSLPAAAP